MARGYAVPSAGGNHRSAAGHDKLTIPGDTCRIERAENDHVLFFFHLEFESVVAVLRDLDAESPAWVGHEFTCTAGWRLKLEIGKRIFIFPSKGRRNFSYAAAGRASSLRNSHDSIPGQGGGSAENTRPKTARTKIPAIFFILSLSLKQNGPQKPFDLLRRTMAPDKLQTHGKTASVRQYFHRNRIDDLEFRRRLFNHSKPALRHPEPEPGYVREYAFWPLRFLPGCSHRRCGGRRKPLSDADRSRR